MHEKLHSAVYFFRLGMNGAACTALAQFIEGLALELHAGSVVSEGLMPRLRLVLEAQKTNDFLRVADMLEYELGPTL